MTETIWFLFGLMAGGTLGMIGVCLFQINEGENDD